MTIVGALIEQISCKLHTVLGQKRPKSIKSARFQRGSMAPMTCGFAIAACCATPFVLDIPLYYNYQQQLQTAMDSATLAAAYAYPNGEAAAEAAAYDMLASNPVAGHVVDPSSVDFTFDGTTVSVQGHINAPLVGRQLLCSMMIQTHKPDENQDAGLTPQDSNAPEQMGVADCDSINVSAGSTAVPAARDTILAIDHSGSMNELLYGKRPINEVKKAAKKYVDYIIALQNKSIDRIGLVTFSYYGKNNKNLTSNNDSGGFAGVKTAIDNIGLSNDGVGWETNYASGLKQAIDMLNAQARPNADKIVIFLTDGGQNTPGPSGSGWTTNPSRSVGNVIQRCTDMVYNAPNFKQAACTSYYDSRGRLKWTCPTLPSSQIPDWAIPQSAVDCAHQYVNTMLGAADTQITRARDGHITIHTIAIIDESDFTDGSAALLRRLLKDPTWIAPSLYSMSDQTDGNYYSALGYNENSMASVYQQIAINFKPILTHAASR